MTLMAGTTINAERRLMTVLSEAKAAMRQLILRVLQLIYFAEESRVIRHAFFHSTLSQYSSVEYSSQLDTTELPCN